MRKFSSRYRKMAVGAILIGAMVLATSAFAAPSGVGSPLVGAFCSDGGAIAGTGSTFQVNAISNFVNTYNANCGRGSVTYTGTGSGAGIRANRDRTATFGGSDDPLAADAYAAAIADTGDPTAPRVPSRPSALHHIPIAVGAVTVSYNLASCGIGQETLSFRSNVLASIFSGAITNWNSPALTVDNPALASCNKQIRLAVRSDVSGTTFVFKDYLSKRNPQFMAYKQPQFNAAWPAQDLGLNTPLRGAGNGGVASVIKNNDGAIGYVEFSTAKNNLLTWGKVEGASLTFSTPGTSPGGGSANCVLAAQATTTPPSTLSPGWDTVSMTDSPDPLTYSVCSFTYDLVFNNLKTAFGGAVSHGQAQTLVDFLGLAVDDIGQAGLPAAGYAKLPITVQQIAKAGLASITYQ